MAAPAPATPGLPPPLPAKEAALLRDVSKLYDEKQYKKAVKAADQILAKFPTHGDTLAFKGLCVHFLGRKAEAYDLVKLGTKHAVK